MPGAPFPTVLAADDAPLVTDPITWQEAVLALSVFLLGLVAAVVVRRVMVRAIDREGSRHVGLVVGRFVSVVVAAVAAVYALDLLGVSIGPLVGALGVGGIAIAFAAQDILQNFVAGVLLQVRRPFRVGEQIGSGDHEGVVADVNLRTTVLSTYDGLVVYLPNAEVLKNPITNYTRTPVSRTSLTVGLPYDADLERARQVLLQACAEAEGVESSPPPEVWVEEFGESSINVAVRYWHPADIASRWRVRSAVAVSLKGALDAAGIEIPFPQRVLWFPPDRDAGAPEGDGSGER
ncbi:mechanosensitive ion channel family protein [Blastococcus sp. VKM Ac-2987]|uniref:mechanosensitive ion channel family protein n=1 Tax=Blastococcus sp. VKM Ac-2987 TaxID=3004141 RepID=UPI0022AB99EF|nr:mechanosensitive ion channel family protein [Blastococcus sp. VKM Ac-2987]MCZ2860525.1 mechanosensitive ion channel family protein [Blastococcus sp. VKM Ac-2987]